MADVTFGVKVPEEMKNELSELMKDSSLSGKEFMGLLLASYKLEKGKKDNNLFENDLGELQTLLKRVQSIYIHMIEKSQLNHQEHIKDIKEEIEAHLKEKEILIENQKRVEADLEVNNQKVGKYIIEIDNLKKELESSNHTKEQLHQQLSNHLLLHTKFEEEISILKTQLEDSKRLEIEIEERNEENNKLKNRSDELASEIWFLQREIEKLKEEKIQLENQAKFEITQIKDKHDLQLKNSLLEQKLSFKEEIACLKEEISKAHQAYQELEYQYNKKLQTMHEHK